MKTKFLWLLAIGCWLFANGNVQAKDYKYQTVEGDLTKTRIYTLDNGLRVYLSVNKEKPRIQTYIAVRTGSKNDPAETTGLAHYLEHLMFKGTKQFGTNNPEAEAPLLDEITDRYEAYRKLTDPAARKQAYHEIDSVSQIAAQYFIPNEYDKLMAAIGAQGTNAYTSNDVTCYTEDIPSNEIENWAKIQADRFQNMVIRGFHTELEAVYEEYNIGLSSDMRKLFATGSKMLWPNHPYGTQTTIGTQEHLKNPSIVNIKNYFNKWYVPNNVAICMAGDFDPDQTIAIIDKYFADWKPSADVRQPVFAPLPPLTSPKDTTIVGQEAEQIWVAWRAKQANDLQADTLDLMEDVLSNGRAGLFDLDLNQTMKVQRAGAGSELMHDHGGFLLMGSPKQGQSLDEVKTLMMGEIDKLKKGDFPDNLLPSIINNKKRQYYQQLEDNRSRADMFVDAFINEVEWEQEVGKIDRISKITKQEIVDFANKFFTDGYIVVYKKQGIDTLQKKIDKPAITPIPANRDMKSAFVQAVQDAKVEPIQPKFVDFKKDLTFAETRNKLPMLYVKNNENGLFQLNYRFDFGRKADNRYSVVSDYVEYLGTDKYTASELKQKFYELGCDLWLGEGSDHINIRLSGLSENMKAALELTEELLQNARVDREAYRLLVDQTLKHRNDMKKNQRFYFSQLYNYGVFGARNFYSDVLSEQQLRDTDPQVFVDLLKGLASMRHTVEYYGPLGVKEASALIGKVHKTPKQLKDVPQNREYERMLANKDEVWIAPYDAKNIYMRMLHDEHRPWNVDETAVQSLFNEYFGGGMNGIVFQELREARGLAYNASAWYAHPQKKGNYESYFTHIITQNDKMMDCVREFHHILNEFPASENAFKIAKEGLSKQLASLRVTKMGIIDRWRSMQDMGLDYDLNEKIYNDLEKVTLQDIVNFEKNNMANKAYRYIILGDEKSLDMESLEKIAPVRRLTTEEVFGY
ncbi:MAG: insulinase family protein [Prevotella sp.]|nr:insulinase family protein [Prevotella sp.]